MTRFVVDLGDIALSKDQQAAINADMQKVALTHMAGHMPADPHVFLFPGDWWGFILRQDFERLLEGEKSLQRGLLQTQGRM